MSNLEKASAILSEIQCDLDKFRSETRDRFDRAEARLRGLRKKLDALPKRFRPQVH